MAAKEYYHYDPSLPAAAAFLFLFLITTSFHLYQMIRTRTWYFTSFVIGGVLECIGFLARAINARQTPGEWSFLPFVIQSLGILLAPAFFAASIYMEFGRIILLVDGEALSFVKKKWLTKLFVSGDVLSFLFQSVGGGILAKQDASSANLGKAIVEIGLSIQIVFFGFFLVNLVTFWSRIHKQPTVRSEDMPWKKHLTALLAAGTIILARCIYRIIEYVEGPTGELMTNEIYLYVLDAGLMLVVMLIFHFWHPSEVRSLLKGGKAARLFRVYTVLKQDQREADVPLTTLESRPNRIYAR